MFLWAFLSVLLGPIGPLVETSVENLVENSGNSPRPFESFSVGEHYRSPESSILAENVRAFAELTGDCNPIHLDAEFARKTVFRQPVAHGLYLASILAGMAFKQGILGRNILALEKSQEQYLQPVRIGDRVVGTVMISAMDSAASKRCGRITWKLCLLRLESDGAETQALNATWESLVFKEAFLR